MEERAGLIDSLYEISFQQKALTETKLTGTRMTMNEVD